MTQTTYVIDLSNLVDSIRDLPSLPAVAQEAVSIAGDPAASAADLAKIIQVDPSLTAKILRVTNSAYYGLSRKIANVKEAIVVMGFVSVRSLAIAVNAMKLFEGTGSANFDPERFWMHSACSALLARNLAALSKIPDASGAFTAGLLHDIGKIVLDQFAHEAFEEVLETQKREGAIDPATELRIINTTHAEVGRRLCERWKLPTQLCEAIGGHHDMAKPVPHPAFACLCSVADYLCTVNDMRSVVNPGKPPDPSNAIKELNMPTRVLGEADRSFPSIYSEAKELIKL